MVRLKGVSVNAESGAGRETGKGRPESRRRAPQKIASGPCRCATCPLQVVPSPRRAQCHWRARPNSSRTTTVIDPIRTASTAAALDHLSKTISWPTSFERPIVQANRGNGLPRDAHMPQPGVAGPPLGQYVDPAHGSSHRLAKGASHEITRFDRGHAGGAGGGPDGDWLLEEGSRAGSTDRDRGACGGNRRGGASNYDTNGNGTKGDVDDIKAIIHDGAAKHGGSPLMAPWPMLSADQLQAVADYVKSMHAG